MKGDQCDFSMVAMACEHGADLNYRTADLGNNLLHIAAIRNDLLLMQFVLNKNSALKDQKNLSEETPAFVAA